MLDLEHEQIQRIGAILSNIIQAQPSKRYLKAMKAARTIVLAAMSLLVGQASLAAQIYPKVYDATYDSKTPAGAATLRMTSDGKGKLRTESSTAGMKVVSIVNYPEKMSYSILENQKMITKSPIKMEYEGEMNADMAKKKKATDLGIKDVLGHKCHGWKYNEAGTDMEMWMDEGAGIMVRSITKASGYSTELNLKTYNATAPNPALFAIPSNYKVVNAGSPSGY